MMTRAQAYSLILIAVIGLCFSGQFISRAAGPQETQDKRKLTTIQTATVNLEKTQKAVEVLYLNLPWGEKTFSYLEQGGNEYYSTRTWPFAHLKLRVKATYEGKALEPGDYMMIITPKNGASNKEMTLSVAAFKPDGKTGTFLVPGDVFVETPDDAVLINKKAIQFGKGGPMADNLKIDLSKSGDKGVDINVHYGDRTLTEKLNLE